MYNISSGYILENILYIVFGTQNVTYNSVTYTTGQTFRGVRSITAFTFSGTGTQLVYELSELYGSTIIFDENAIDSSLFTDITNIGCATIEYQQNANDIVFNEITALNSFAIELTDFPFYSFAVIETRL